MICFQHLTFIHWSGARGPRVDAIALIISERTFSLAVSCDCLPSATVSVSWCLTRAVSCAEGKLSLSSNSERFWSINWLKFRLYRWIVKSMSTREVARQKGLQEHSLVLVWRLKIECAVFLDAFSFLQLFCWKKNSARQDWMSNLTRNFS